MTQPLPVHIRWLISRDMPEVSWIEQSSFDFPWEEQDFLTCLRRRDCIGMVAEISDKADASWGSIVGFMLYELQPASVSLLNFAVHLGYRRRSVGRQLLAKLQTKLSSHRRTSITLEVREANLAAQLFFQRQGFKAVQVLRGYYEDSGEDAYQLRYLLPGAAEEPIGGVSRLARYCEEQP